MKNVPALEAAILAADYAEQAELIRNGKRNVAFAYEHGKTIGQVIGSVTPTLFQVPDILINGPEKVTKLCANNAVFVHEWATKDGALNDLRRSWSVSEKAALFFGVLFHGGLMASVAHSVNVDNLLEFNKGMDTVDRVVGNSAVKASRVILGKRKDGKQ